MLPTAHESTGLDREHIGAVRVLVGLGRQERIGRELTMDGFGELFVTLDRRYVDAAVMTGFVLSEIGIALTIGAETLDIEFLDNHSALTLETLTLAEHFSVLGDIGTAGENDVGSRFAYAG